MYLAIKTGFKTIAKSAIVISKETNAVYIFCSVVIKIILCFFYTDCKTILCVVIIIFVQK